MMVVTMAFCRAVMAMALVTVAVVVARVVPANAAELEIVRASAAGAAWTALAEMTMASPPAPTVTPRLVRNSRRRASARMPDQTRRHRRRRRAWAISRADLRSK